LYQQLGERITNRLPLLGQEFGEIISIAHTGFGLGLTNIVKH